MKYWESATTASVLFAALGAVQLDMAAMTADPAEPFEVRGGNIVFDVSTNVSALNVHGKSTALEARFEVQRTAENLVVGRIEASVGPASLTTGMGLRDEHMRKYIFTTGDGQVPELRFVAEKALCPHAAPGKEVPCRFEGNLTIRGVTKPFTMLLKLKEENAQTFHAAGDTVLKLGGLRDTGAFPVWGQDCRRGEGPPRFCRQEGARNHQQRRRPMSPARRLASAALLSVLHWATPAFGLPTMIRLGYTNCAACHISPQGAGLLNDYGRGIDEAQSLRAREYKPTEAGWVRTISWGGRITQDVRTVMQEQLTSTAGQPLTNFFRPRVMYRNATELGKGFRLSAVVTGETESAPRPAMKYDPANPPAQVFLNSALVSYRPSKSVEFAAGRDPLPTGLNIPDLGVFVRSRNRQGYYDAPTQVKMFWWGKRYQVTPFAYGPGGNEPPDEKESGGGALAEFDLLGRQRTIVGVSALGGSARNGGRTLLGAYTRLGFGKWGILAEHDVTQRTRNVPAIASFRQDTTYGQLFWAAKEWLVLSGITERLYVTQPYAEHLVAAKAEVAARLSANATVIAGMRFQENRITGRFSKALVVQVALKTVN